MLDHLRMAADVSDGVAGVEFPVVGILAKDVVGAANFTRPVRVIPWAAHRRHIFEPGQFLVELIELFQISKLPRTAGAIEQIKFVIPVEASFFPIFGECAHIADERSHAGNRGDQKMIGCFRWSCREKIFPSELFASATGRPVAVCKAKA